VVKRFVAIACCIALAACAAAPRPGKAVEAPPRAVDAGGGALPPSKQDQIKQLEQAIAADSATLELAEPAAADYLNMQPVPMGAPPPEQLPNCKPGKSETCTTSCTLSTSICTNADKICKLAIDINDDWARGKCAKANKSCEASRTKCCGCQ
jgi:hypothetical protein